MFGDQRFNEGLDDGSERRFGEVRGDRGGGGDAGGADGGVGVAEPAEDGGEEFGEVRRERVAVRLGEEGDEAEALFTDGGLVGGVGGGDGGDERRNGIVS